MAGKAGVDDSVIERRLRPIYEWLDLGNSRKAIQECDKVLKKQPSLHCARVLRGLALLRSGKPDVAGQTIAQVVAECPTDDSTLQALTIYYREIHDLEKICMIYEEATKKESKNEELLSHLFMAYVRVGNYKRQQQSAMALYKIKPKNPYYFWAVISIVMQAREADASSSCRQVCLALAERMVEKFLKEGKLEAEAEVLAYLYILELQGKYSKALSLVSGEEVSAKITQQPGNFLQLKTVQYNLKLERWQEAQDWCRTLILAERDNWQHYERFCRCLIKVHQTTEELSVLSDGVMFLQKVLEDSVEEHGSKYRAPYLAHMQLLYELDKAGLGHLGEGLGVRMEEQLLQYLRRFGGKWCAFSDVRRFFQLLPRAAAPELLQQLQDLVALPHEAVPADAGTLHRHLTWLQVARCFPHSPHDATVEGHLADADATLQLYSATHHLAGQTVATDIRQNDCYMLLSGNSVLKALTLLNNKQSSRSDGSTAKQSNGKQERAATVTGAYSQSADAALASKLLLKLAGVLEAAVLSSKANFQLKLLLLQVYNMIGACGSSRTCYESLEIKSVQLDTLGNVLALQALDAAHYDLATSIFSQTNSFFVSAAKDTCEPMIQAYKYGSLTRIPEFADFRDRLERSVHFATVTAEQMILDLTYTLCNHKAATAMLDDQCIDPVTDRTDYATLVDNTDHTVKLIWEHVFRDTGDQRLSAATDADSSSTPSTDSLESESGSSGGRKTPAKEVLEELMLRNGTLRLLGAAHKLCSPKSSNNSDAVQQFTAVLTELQEIVHREATEQKEDLIDCTRVGCSRAVGDYKRLGFMNCTILHANLLLHLHFCYHANVAGGKVNSPLNRDDAWQSTQLKACQDSLSSLLSRAIESVTALLCTAATAAPSSVTALHALHHSAQTVGIVLILLGFSSNILRTVKVGAGGKKSKKKKDAPTAQPESVDQFSKYICWMECELESLQNALLTKLSTAKQNSHNNSGSLYSSLTATFSESVDRVAEATEGLQRMTLDSRLPNGVGSEDKNEDTKTLIDENCTDDRSKKNSAIDVKKEAGRVDTKQKNKKSKKENCKITSSKGKDEQKLEKSSSEESSIECVAPDFVRTCLTIDASFQESLANLKTSLGAKLKYVASLKL